MTLEGLIVAFGNIRNYKINGEYKTIGFDEVHTDVDENGHITLYINGSDSDPKEWFSNFNAFIKIKGRHLGCYRSAKRIYKNYMSKLSHENLTIVCHSRGGGIGVVYADMYGGDVVSFGAMRSLAWWKKPKFKHTRVTFNGEIVDNVPPKSMGYKHHQTDLIILNRGDAGRIESHKNYLPLLEKECNKWKS